MISRNKKIFCFIIVMFITLISCCAVSASGNVDNNISTTTIQEKITTQNVEQTTTNNYEETITSTQTSMQSENKTIEETNDNNEIKANENTNAKAIKKAKNTNQTVKTQSVTRWSSFPSSGTVDLEADISATSTKSSPKDGRIYSP